MKFSWTGISRHRYARIHRIGIGIFAVMLLSGSAIAMQDLPPGAVLITQKNRAFDPGTVEIDKGQTLHIVNDDGQLMHHAYVASSNFNFDSGEQLPGTAVDIQFPGLGRYFVLCGIHPKMRLAVTVR